ncbi:MAG TPA: hypothetical protein VEQ16_09765 [Acidocella sp.]|nr:hypothetical protein [Acidocella sp.]
MALLLYVVTAWVLLAHGASPMDHIFGLTSDPYSTIWCLRYLPWAIAHHQLMPVTHLVWQPYGINLAWVTSVPLFGLFTAPITLTFGPVLSFNLLTLAAPALAGWATYFLCLEIGELPWAAMLGGFIFAFSSYEAAQSFDHLNLDFTALLPLILLVALRRLRGRAGRGHTVLWLGLLLGTEFLISEEILATACLFGAICFLLAYIFETPRRPAMRALALDIVFAAPVALLLTAPILLAMAGDIYDVEHPALWVESFSVDALNLLLPTESSWLGGRAFLPWSEAFSGALDEQMGYLGLPVLLLLGLVLANAKLRRTLWLPLSMFGLALLASLGPVLHVAGHNTGIILPWALIARLPLLGAALPARCMVFAFLALSIIVSFWLSVQLGAGRVLLALCVCLSLLPAPHPAPTAPASAFFRPGRVQQILGSHPTLLILPFSINGPSSFWQAENEFGFTQVGGYLGFPPHWAQNDPAVTQLWSGKLTPGFTQDLTSMAERWGADYVVAGPGTPADQRATLATLGWRAQNVDDVTIYAVPKVP